MRTFFETLAFIALGALSGYRIASDLQEKINNRRAYRESLKRLRASQILRNKREYPTTVPASRKDFGMDD